MLPHYIICNIYNPYLIQMTSGNFAMKPHCESHLNCQMDRYMWRSNNILTCKIAYYYYVNINSNYKSNIYCVDFAIATILSLMRIYLAPGANSHEINNF